VNRRGFIKLLLAGTAGIALTPLAPQELSVKLTWVTTNDAQKHALVLYLVDNAIESHDALIEEMVFRASVGADRVMWEAA
jgi:hypothetical protein